MMKIVFFAVVTILVCNSNLYAAQAPDFKISVENGASGLMLEATPPSQHHINIHAPMDLFDGLTHHKPSSSTPQKARFQLAKSAKIDLIVSLYLCDEKNTYCEKHSVSIKLADDKLESPSTTPSHSEAARDLHSATQASNKPRIENGFYINNPKLAFEEAARQKKPLLIDFFGIWCPPCNELDELVFGSAEFKKATRDFVKLKLDADTDVSWDLKSRYKVSGYPTVVFTSSDGEEISRIVGFRAKLDFVSEIKRAWDSRQETFAVLKTKADSGDKSAAERLGLIYLERKDFEKSSHYLEGNTTHKIEYLNSKIGLLEQAGNAQQSKLAQTLEDALADFPSSLDATEWRTKLADLCEEKREIEKRNIHLEAGVKLGREFISHPERLIGKELTAGDLWAYIAQAEERLGHSTASQQAWSNGAKWYAQELQRFGTKKANSERGFNLERAYCLWKAGKESEADALYKSLEKKYPQEFTFFFNHARMQLEFKKYEEALPTASHAYLHSYGDNRLRVALLLAQIFEAKGLPQKGLDVVRQTLKGTPLPKDPNIRTHRYVQKLKDLEAKLNSSLSHSNH